MERRHGGEQLEPELAAARRRIAELEAVQSELEGTARTLQHRVDQSRAQFLGMPSPVYAWQVQGRDLILVDYNDAAHRVTHGSVAQLVGARASALYRDEPSILADMWRCYEDKHSFGREMDYRYRLTGEHRYLAVSYGFVAPDMVLVHSEDVTEHRQAQHALQRERDFISAILDTVGTLVVVLDPQGRIVRFNRACEQATGYAFGEVEGKRFWELFLLREEAQAVKEVFRDLVAGQFPNEHENHWVRRDGDLRLIAWSNTALLDETGAVEYVIGTGVDVTERRRAEDALQRANAELDLRVQERTAELLRLNQALAESEERFRLAFEHAPVGMALVGLDGRFLRANHSLCSMLGYPEQELLRKSFQELTHPADLGISLELLQDIAAGRRDFGWLEKRYVCQDGHVIWALLSTSLVRDAQGSPAYYVSQLQDVTERKEARELLEERVAARTRELSALYDVTTVASASLDLQTVLAQSLSRVLEVMRCETGGIHLREGPEEVLRLALWQGPIPGMTDETETLSPLGREVDWVMTHGEPLMVSDLWPSGVSPSPRPDQAAGPIAYVGVPVHTKGRVLGALSVVGEPGRRFSAEEVALLASIAGQVGVAVENAHLYEQAERLAVLEERDRLARELHDAVTQSLYSSYLMVETARRAADAGDLDHTRASLTRLGEVLGTALKEMRLLLYELRPPALEGETLIGAIHKRLDAVERRAGLEARLLVEGDARAPVEVEEPLYWIAQEALNNALKHAAATAVTVSVQASDGQVCLEVADNGRGLDPQAAENSGGLGLHTMRQRAERAGATLQIDSRPGAGTRIRVTVKLDPEEGQGGRSHPDPGRR
ncbi:MAG: PAS domain S-box protein [Anaerolineae bacterium]|nr:PAS domain S-box protein [Anaerolineae bacterium]